MCLLFSFWEKTILQSPQGKRGDESSLPAEDEYFLNQPGQNEEDFSMYYSSGNYEAFARPRKPEGGDQKSAYIVGSGLAALTAA